MSNNIRKLTDYQHCRLRTEMYLGSRAPHTQIILNANENGKLLPTEMTWVPALYTAFREILDNSNDEINHGFGNRIDVLYNPEQMLFSVEDNGRGIPTDWDEVEQMHKCTLALTHARTGRNFETRNETVGTNGIGAAAVNFCSEFFNITIHHKNEKFIQNFKEGNAVFDELHIEKPQIRKINSDKSGTKIEWKLSSSVFSNMTLPEEFIKSRVIEVAAANPNVKITYNGEVVKVKSIEKEFFKDLNVIKIEINKPDFNSIFYIVPEFSESEMVHSLVNNIPAFNGGIHMDTFKTEFFKGLLLNLEKEGKRRKIIPNRSDINDGLLIYNITKMKAPDFDSQSKTRLINEWVGKEIKDFFKDEDVIKNIVKKNKEWIDLIFERAFKRTNKKEEDETRKLAKAAKKAKVEKLRDATGTDRTKCILFITEGDSAVSEMSSARTPEIHGGLPLKGKVLNVNGESTKTILNTQALVDIMNSIGLSVDERANRYKLRYGKIFIATDMDPDGANIAALLINFFYTYWPELFDDTKEPFIYLFMTPFIIACKGKVRKYWYGHNHLEFNPDEYSKKNGWDITRAKGLASLTKEDWKFSLEKPVVFSITNDDNLKESLDLIFNQNRSNDRKVWIGLD
jgi:DNA gyrase/topoisomerase IV subunit B